MAVGLPTEEEVYAMDREVEEEALREVFSKYDADGSGAISRDELRAAARDFNLASTDDELDALIAKVDTDGDGEISFDEFVNAKIAKVIEVDSVGRLLELVSGGGKGPAPVTLVEFHAPFCRTCRNMRGRFAKLPGRRPDAQFLSVDVKKQRPIADELGIKDVPSYVLFKNGERKGQWKGAFRVDQLEEFLNTDG
jgi:thiol-disulfide isomerase/thioredoxin